MVGPTIMPNVSWNVFRLLADFLHLAGMSFGVATIWQSKSVAGFSRKTQVMLQMVFISRYLDVFIAPQGMYLMFFKFTFNALTALMLFAFHRFSSTYDAQADSCNLVAMLLPTFVLAILADESIGFIEAAWTFSELLEPLALIPQYIICYRASRVRPVAVIYVLAVGGYRVLYVCNWIYKRFMLHGAYHDWTSWIGGTAECILFFDFLFRISQKKDVIGAIGASPLGRLLLKLDDGAGRISEKVEMSTFGRRIPYGLSGPGSQDDETARKQWDVTDKLGDEESCNLLTLNGDADTL